MKAYALMEPKELEEWKETLARRNRPESKAKDAELQARRDACPKDRSKQYGDHCYVCEREITLDAPVYRAKVRSPCDNWWTRACCADCGSVGASIKTACAVCSRDVYQSQSWKWQVGDKAPSFCSEQCRQKHTIQKQKLSRQTAMQNIVCTVCGDTFTPKRTDSKYCSCKCRQKAYRQRGA